MAEILEELVSLTKKMIRLDSTNPGANEELVADFIAGWLKGETGISAVKEYWAPGRCNVLAEIKGLQEKLPPVVLSGHMDTVPAGEGWNYNPFEGTEKDGYLYGRGAADMKSGLAAAMLVFRAIAQKKELPVRSLIFAATSDEEGEMRGAEALVKNGLIPADCWFLDVDSVNEEIVQGHKGKIWYRVSSIGKAAHSMNPSAGVDAVAALAEFICRFRRKVEALASDSVFGSCSVCFGTVAGGIGFTTVPEKATVQMDLRLVPPVTEDDCNKLIQETALEAELAVKGSEFEWEIISSRPWIPVLKDSPLALALQSAIFRETGSLLQPSWIGGYTDSGAVAALTGNINCISFGVKGENLHAANERLPVDSLLRVYRIVLNLCEKEFFGN